jgi:membrane-bound ClpP family serine protease
MEWLILVSLIFLGLVLVLVEILFIPGTTVVGILGVIVGIIGLIYAFLTFENQVALGISGLSIGLHLAAVWYGFSSGLWRKFSLKSTQSGGAYDGRMKGLEVGMEGKAVSDIKPIGKAVFHGEWYEVKSEAGFIDVGATVIISKLEHNTISVK